MARLSLYVRQHSQVAIVFLIGVVLVLAGIPTWWKYPRISTILISTGTSLIAAAVVTYLSPATQEVYQRFLALGISDVYLSRRDIQDSQWVEWLRSARHNCTLLGIAHNNWCRDPDFKQLLLERVRSNVQVKIFFLNPTSNIAEVRAAEDKRMPRDTIQTIRDSIRFMWETKQELEPDKRGNLRLYVYDATPSFGATWIDTFMVATHYLAGFPNVTSPALVIRPVQVGGGSRDLYGIYVQNMRAVEQYHSVEIAEDNVERYV